MHVVIDGGLNLLLTLGGVDSLGSTLRNVAGTIKLGTLAAVPQWVKWYALAIESGCRNLLRHDGVAAAHTGKACRFRVRVELDGALTGTTNLVNAMWNLIVLDVSLISSIVEDECIVLKRVVYPLAQLGLRDNRTCGVVRIAQVDNINAAVGQLGHKAVLGITRHIQHIRPTTILLNSRTTNHHVRIDINRIDRIGNADRVIPAHQLLNITRIALGTIVDKHLVAIQMYSAWQEIVLQDSITQEIVALLWSVSTETLSGSHLVGGLVDSLDNGRCQWLRYIAYAQRNNIYFWVHGLKGVYLFCNVGEQIIVRQLQEVVVY